MPKKVGKAKKPTMKQKKAALKSLENGGNISQAMIEAGYSPNTANTPQKLTDSLGWEALMEKYIPDTRLAEALNEGLEANKQLAARVIFKKEAPTSQSAGELPLANSMTDDFIEVPDYAVRHKFLETSLKVKGRLTNKTDVTTNGEKLEPTHIIIVEDKQEE